MPTTLDVDAMTRAWNTQDLDRIMEHYADDAIMEQSGLPLTVRGKAQIREVVEEFLNAFPDVNADVAWRTTSEGKAAALVRVTATHRGELEVAPGQTVPATGNRVEYDLAILMDVNDDGKIAHERDVFDSASFVKQLGIPLETVSQETPTQR